MRNEISGSSRLGVKGSSRLLRESIERKLNDSVLDRRIGVKGWSIRKKS